MDKQKQRISNLKSEVADLSSEFETDRQMYLETIRKQEREIMLLQAWIIWITRNSFLKRCS